jgi:bifunctional UDP-N-acetylglucosamine pyrophosphorylase/glucosamine-1-phosphate N-acetyltransferase
MPSRQLAAIVLAAGQGTRMHSALPKVLHPIGGRPMVKHLLATVETLGADRIVVVVGPDMETVAGAVAPWPTALQADRLGTAHAVSAALPALGDTPADDALVLYGDTPLVSAATLRAMLAARAGADDPAVVVLGMRSAAPNEYGRLVLDAAGGLDAIVEWREATPDQRALPLCNSGVMAIDGRLLAELLGDVRNDNAKGEYYLTDVVALARARGRRCAVVEADEAELRGVNSRAELAAAEAVLQQQFRAAAMAGGATLTAPETVYFSFDTRLGQDVSIGPFVHFGPGVTVGDGVTIKSFCHFEGAVIEAGAIIGPYARLRPGADIGRDVHIGNFVEVKAARLDAGAKANHLSYIGDAFVGAGANIGAGTITCNYDGFLKHRTHIGAGTFIGSNTALVAPVTVGDGAITGAGGVVTKDVPADALYIERAKPAVRPGWAAAFRERMAGFRK